MDNEAQFSGIFDTIIGGVATVLPFIRGSNSGTGSGTARGLEAITQATNQILGALDKLISDASAVQPNERSNIAGQVMSQAQQLVNALSDPAIIYQAKRGDDAMVLNNAKNTARAKLAQLDAVLTATGSINNFPANSQVVIGADGTRIIPPNVSTNEGFDTKLLMYGALGAIALYFVTKDK